ncbi:hypothetical protein RBH26_20630 [Natronolimnohabitans sp. A-GB9]|uniref:hypothetical protein n=1 Tax=Natronolimnohabitans sp. A-GB9 TaxID=3069757 RepID=UPI0027B2F840|nr:hypothetical protein [Natronolimnohabitans sp. A-GB9]MDQ2052851.1 hypothetical protein [Natronolimnohabitans sp. A-GB9]
MSLGGTREQRVTLALKWRHLDGCDIQEIRDRFEEEGYGRPSRQTVHNYLDEKEAEDVLDQIKQKHAETRLQIADREEQMYRRARADEHRAVRDEPIKRVVPQTDTVSNDRESPMQWPDWEVLDPDDEDFPEWASERDTVIRFLDRKRSIMPGEEYPLRSVDGTPKYTTEMVGLERDQPDIQKRAMARQEQSKHLEAKGEVLGIYTDHIELDVDEDRSIDEGDKAELVDAIESLRDGDAGGNGSEE